jgi:hypothetical protein
MSLEAENVHMGVSHIRHRFPVTFLRPCRFIYCDCLFFLQNENNSFQHKTSIYLSLQRRKRVNSALCSIFQLSLKRKFFSEKFSVHVVETCQTCYRH